MSEPDVEVWAVFYEVMGYGKAPLPAVSRVFATRDEAIGCVAELLAERRDVVSIYRRTERPGGKAPKATDVG